VLAPRLACLQRRQRNAPRTISAATSTDQLAAWRRETHHGVSISAWISIKSGEALQKMPQEIAAAWHRNVAS